MTAQIGKLRNIRNDELSLMLSWRNAPNVRANMYTQHIISEEEHLTWWDKVKTSEYHRYFMYECGEEPVGIVALTDIAEKSSSWAFYASPNAPAGTGSKMEFLALDYVFETLKLHELNCEVLSFNKPVLGLHNKFGFQVIETIKGGHTNDGQSHDIYKLQLTAEQWAEKRPVLLTKVQRR